MGEYLVFIFAVWKILRRQLMVCDSSGVMTDWKWVRANSFDHIFAPLVLIKQLGGIDRWFELLQFFQEPEVFCPYLILSLLIDLNVQRFTVDNKIGSGWRDWIPSLLKSASILGPIFQVKWIITDRCIASFGDALLFHRGSVWLSV